MLDDLVAAVAMASRIPPAWRSPTTSNGNPRTANPSRRPSSSNVECGLCSSSSEWMTGCERTYGATTIEGSADASSRAIVLVSHVLNIGHVEIQL